MPITGKRLVTLLLADGWEIVRRSPHGLWMRKTTEGRTRFATVKDTREHIPPSTLGQILGPKQTGLGAQGLADMDRRVK